MTFAPSILSAARAVPRHRAEQDEIVAALRGLWSSQHFNTDRLDQLFKAVRVGTRYLALPMDEYLRVMPSFGKRNDAWIQTAIELGSDVVGQAVDRAGLKPDEIDHFFFVTVTGVAAPSVDARIANRLRMATELKRTPIFGIGCAAGALGIARAADYLRAFPDETALLLSVELCSLTLQPEDLSVTNIIASGLFGDGAAAVVLAGGDRATARGPRVVRSRSVRYPDSERVMGWDVIDTGFKVVLSAQVPAIVRQHLAGDVDRVLTDAGLRREDIRHWLCHTGGPRVIEAVQEALDLPSGALDRSWASLQEFGNLSSASVLFVLDDFLRDATPESGDWGMMIAMGPGFGSELVLLRW